MSSVQIFKLVSGEEIVGRVDSFEEGTDVLVKNPLRIDVVQTGPGQFGLSLQPFLKGAPDAPIPIKEHSIITTVEAPREFASAYLSQTSGIELVSSLAL